MGQTGKDSAAGLHRPPQVITELKPLYPDTLLVKDGKALGSLVVPEGQDWAALAERVVRRVREATGATLAVKTDDTYREADRGQHLLCLGQMMNNRLALELYVHHYTTADDWFPGPGGWELRTVCDPWGNGRNVILLGGSDLAGAQKAADRFCARIAPGPDLVLPRLLDTGFRDRDRLDQWLPGYLTRFRADYLGQPHLPYGNERRLIETARYYHLTGDNRLAEMLAAGIRHWMADYCRYIPDRQITQPKYMIPLMILDWDVVEEHPAFSDDLRLEYTNLLYDYVARMGVHRRITQLEPGVLTATGHHRVSLTVSYGSRYFKTYYPAAPMDRIDAGMARVRTGLDTIKHTYGFFDENGGYTQYYPTTTMWNSLFLDDLTYFTSGNAQKWLRQSLIYLDNLGSLYCGPSESYGVGEWFYRDGKWAWLQDELSGKTDYSPQITATAFEAAAWSYRPRVRPVAPTGWMEGIQWLPVHKTVYAQLKRQQHRINVPQEKTFHVLSMRPTYDRNAEYLRLDGVNAGLANGGDGNAIVSLTAKGHSWLASGQWGQYYRMKYHNSVMVVREGLFPDDLVALCSLEAAADLPSCGLVQSLMKDYNGTDWARSIVWLKNGWFAVCDTLLAREEGNYGFFCRWRAAQPGRVQNNAIRLTAGDSELDIVPAGGGRLAAFSDEGVNVFSEGQTAHLKAGQSRTFITLLRARNAAEAPTRVRRLSRDAALMLDAEEPAIVGAALPVNGEIPTTKLGDGLTVRARLFYLSARRLCAADLTRLDWGAPLLSSDDPVNVEVDLTTGKVSIPDGAAGLKVLYPGMEDAELRKGLQEALAGDLERLASQPVPDEDEQSRRPARSTPARRWASEKPGAVCSLSPAGTHGEVAMGTEDGFVAVLDAAGKDRWRYQAKGRINALAVADLDGDGAAEVLAACDDYSLYCLDDRGLEKWRFNTRGIPITRQTGGVYGPGLYIDSEGEVATVMSVDLEGNGRKSVLVGTKTFMHGGRRVFGTLYCLDPSGQPRWHLYQSGGTVSSIDTADVNADGRQEILIGTSGNYAVADYLLNDEGEVLARYNCYEGIKDKRCSLASTLGGEPPRAVRLDMSNTVVEAFETEPPYRRAWRQACDGLGGCGPVVSDLDGDGREEIVVGSKGGSVYALKETLAGEIQVLWRTDLQDPVSEVIAADVNGDGRAEIIAGSYAGRVYVLTGASGQVADELLCAHGVTRLAVVKTGNDGEGLVVGTKGGVERW